ncbi:MAG: hypothetical protein JO019_02775, partial [Candidatus Kaiserbacteria bacterium]|nr:hypothetical protein [Candidatus Kaiserbacteria bacterium]
MRVTVASLTTLLCVLGAFSIAEAQSAPGSKISCVKPGFTEVKRYGGGGEKIADAQTGVPNAAKSQISNCADQKVTISTNIPAGTSPLSVWWNSDTYYVEIVITTTRACCTVEDQKKYGCMKGQTEPTLTYVDTLTHKDFTLSKCNAKLAAAIDASAQVGSDGTYSDQALRDIAIAVTKDSDPTVSTGAGTGGTAAGSDEIIKAFTATGVDEERAKAIVTSNPTVAADYIRALETGDKEQIASTAKTLGLNPDLIVDTKKLIAITGEPTEIKDTPQTGPATGAVGPQTGFGDKPQTPDTTPAKPLPGGVWAQLFKQAEDKYGIGDFAPGILAQKAKIESGGNPRICSDTGACGLFQYIGGT